MWFNALFSIGCRVCLLLRPTWKPMHGARQTGGELNAAFCLAASANSGQQRTTGMLQSHINPNPEHSQRSSQRQHPHPDQSMVHQVKIMIYPRVGLTTSSEIRLWAYSGQLPRAPPWQFLLAPAHPASNYTIYKFTVFLSPTLAPTTPEHRGLMCGGTGTTTSPGRSRPAGQPLKK